MIKKRIRGNPIPLIVEKHPSEYKGYPFITLIQYKDQDFLVIIDNYDDKNIDAYVLDLCKPAEVNEEHLIEIVHAWWEERRENFPVSFEFSRLGITNHVSRIYRSFHIEYVTRVIGPLPFFEMGDAIKIKRRKKKPIPNGMEVHMKDSVLPFSSKPSQ